MKAAKFFSYLSLAVLSGVMLLAGILKILDPASLLESVLRYRMGLSYSMAWLVAMILPWLEVLCGVMLWVPAWRKASMALVGAMLTVFCVGLLAAMMRGLDIQCGCFGKSENGHWLSSPEVAFIRNLFLLGLTFIAVRVPLKNGKPHR